MQPNRFERDFRFTLLGMLWAGVALMVFHVSRKRTIPTQRVKEHFASRRLAEAPQQVPTHLSSLARPRKKSMLIGSSSLLFVIGSVALLFALRGFTTQWLKQSLASSDAKAPPAIHRADFQSGVIYPRYSPDAYSAQDTAWQQGLQEIKTSTAARWIEIPVLFSQSSSNATTVQHSYSTASVASFTAGIQAAHAQGYRVFFVPLMAVREPGGWSGSIQPQTPQQQQAWFDSYWNTLQPYAQVAASNGVEQMAVATELQWMQQYVPAPLWNQLISRVHSVFKNSLTYDMNWSSLDKTMPDWLRNSTLNYVGVSEYIPLSNVATRVDPTAMPGLWRDKIKSKLDHLATQLAKRILISEMGYRNSADALYQTWEANTTATTDPAQQAAAYDAAFQNIVTDPQIVGTFCWGWNNVDRFTLRNQPAAQVLYKWYTQI